LEIAEIQIQIFFYINGPELFIKVADLAPKLNISDHELNAVSMLLSEQGMMDELNEQPMNYSSTANFRDALTNTTTGMSHTLRQMETVVNVKGKLGFFSNLNALLPSADLLAAVEEDSAVASAVPPKQEYKVNPLDNLANHNVGPKNPLLGGVMRNLMTPQQEADPVRLYNVEKPPSPLKLYERTPSPKLVDEITNGWSDDELDIEDELDKNTNNCNATSSLTKVFDNDSIIINHAYDIIPTRKRWNRCAVMIR